MRYFVDATDLLWRTELRGLSAAIDDYEDDSDIEEEDEQDDDDDDEFSDIAKTDISSEPPTEKVRVSPVIYVLV